MKHLKKFNEGYSEKDNNGAKNYTIDDLENAYQAGYDSKECDIYHDEEDAPYINEEQHPTFDKWLEQYNKNK